MCCFANTFEPVLQSSTTKSQLNLWPAVGSLSPSTSSSYSAASLYYSLTTSTDEPLITIAVWPHFNSVSQTRRNQKSLRSLARLMNGQYDRSILINDDHMVRYKYKIIIIIAQGNSAPLYLNKRPCKMTEGRIIRPSWFDRVALEEVNSGNRSSLWWENKIPIKMAI